MATLTPKRLFTSAPGAAANTTVYTATGVTALFSSLNICCTNAAGDTVRVFIVTSGQSAGTGYAAIYDMTIPYGNSYAGNLAITLNAGDFIVVYAAGGFCTFIGSGGEYA